jgi:hypothetical protein
MYRIIGVFAISCFASMLVVSPLARADTVCQGGGNKEVTASCSLRVPKDRYYVIDASAEARADKASEAQPNGQLWMDVFVDDAKRGHAETQCGTGGACRVTIVLQMLLKGGKDYKVEARQGNNRADTHFTRIVVRAGDS